MAPRNATERFRAHTVPGEEGCIIWTGHQAAGYGRFWLEGRNVMAHRAAYELLVGPIPGGLQVDHLCGQALCVNPDHLEPVTPRVNVHRSGSPASVNARKTHCPRGHLYDYLMPDGRRSCKTCARDRMRAWREKRRAA